MERRRKAEEQNLKFVQYTSADAAMSIIRGEKVWIRNVQGINYFSEVGHGRECLVSAYRNENE